MSARRDIRRCALQALYQFDLGMAEHAERVRASLTASPGEQTSHEAGFELAQKAWAARDEADRAVAEFSADWPTYRQPVIDRSILRLAHYEMTRGETPPKVAINEAIELAKEFSTEKSHLFINGILDKILRRMRAVHRGGAESADARE